MLSRSGGGVSYVFVLPRAHHSVPVRGKRDDSSADVGASIGRRAACDEIRLTTAWHSGWLTTAPASSGPEHTRMQADAGTRRFARRRGDHSTISGGAIVRAFGATVLLGNDEVQPRQVSKVSAIQGHQRVTVFDGLRGDPQVVVAGPGRTTRLFDRRCEYTERRCRVA